MGPEGLVLTRVQYTDDQFLNAALAFQVALDAPYVDVDCFSRTDPVIVPARTLLSQLV